MVDTDDFRNWLRNNTEYSDAVIGDTVSRIKRADSILEWDDTETYPFYLEKEHGFEILTVSVRSQIRKAVKLYSTYVNALENSNINPFIE